MYGYSTSGSSSERFSVDFVLPASYPELCQWDLWEEEAKGETA